MQLAALSRPQLFYAASSAAAGHAGDVTEVVDLARGHGVLGLLPSEGSFGPEVDRARRATLARYVRTLHDLARIGEVLAGRGVDWVLVKGAVLAHELYPRPDVRPFADADVVVPPSRLRDTLAALEGAGAVNLVRNWDLMSQLGLAEITLTMPAGTQVDLHWSLANQAVVRDALGFRTDELIARSRSSDLLPGLRTPDDVDTLVHVAWHCTRNGASRLLWLCDVELAAQRVSSRVPELRAAVEHTGTSMAVAVALDRAAIVFPGGSAARVAVQLDDGWWRALNRVSGRRLVSRPPGRRSGKALVRASGRDDLHSLMAVKVPGLGGRPRWGAPVRQSLSADRGGAPGRDRYLEWVERYGH